MENEAKDAKEAKNTEENEMNFSDGSDAEAEASAEITEEQLKALAEQKKIRMDAIAAKYKHICPFCKAFTSEHKACGWKFSEIVPKKVLKHLQEARVEGGKVKACGVFQENPEVWKKTMKYFWGNEWRERPKGC